jgi:predicted MFS family arabinose efflux permease
LARERRTWACSAWRPGIQFVGAWIGGLLHDWTGGYAAVMIFSVASLALAAAALGAEAGERERLSR